MSVEPKRRSADTEIEVLKTDYGHIKTDLAHALAAIKVLEDERTHALKWGVTTLGAGVLLLAGWIVHFIMGVPR